MGWGVRINLKADLSFVVSKNWVLIIGIFIWIHYLDILIILFFWISENPCPQQGNILSIRLSEAKELVSLNDQSQKQMLVDTFFQMNYLTGEWKRVKKYREIEEGWKSPSLALDLLTEKEIKSSLFFSGRRGRQEKQKFILWSVKARNEWHGECEILCFCSVHIA